MSKQPHDQDEQQAPAGADSASSGNGGGGKTGSGRRRSRRYDKGNQDKGNPRQGQAGGSEARKPASAAPASSGDAGQAGGTDKVTAQADQASSADKAADPKAADPKAADPKPADPKAAAPQASAPRGGKAPQGDAGKQAETPRPASGAGGGGGKGATTGGGGGGKEEKRGGKAGLLALVLVILLAIGVVLAGWQAWQRLEAQQQRLASLPADAASQSDLGDLRGQLESAEGERDAALDAAITELRGEFSDYRGSVDETLDEVLDELSREQDTDERDWLHAEAAYLLRLANQRLQLERDVEGAAALLRTADARLREADNPALVPVRREVASELAALDSVPRVDRTGLYLALNAQQEQLAGQPLAQDIEEVAADATIEEAPSGGWQQQLARFGGELKGLVTVRKHDQALEALIAPEQEAYLRQSVRLVLEQSQLALLKEEQELYEASLDKALTLVRGYYDTDAGGVQSVIERLEALKQRSIRPELPDISGSQQALATFIERRFEGRGDGQGGDA